MADYISETKEQKESGTLNYLNSLFLSKNIADGLEKDLLTKMSTAVLEDYRTDVKSREDWDEIYKIALDLARQLPENKTYAGERVNNVKYPLISTTSLQFQARVMPNVVNGNDVVKCRVIGKDPKNLKASKGNRISTHMSYQILEQMESWVDDMDKLLMVLPISGCILKKTFKSHATGDPNSITLLPDEFAVNYYAKSVENVPVTHIYDLMPNEVEERIRSGVFIDYDYDKSTTSGETEKPKHNEKSAITFLEQHTWYDIDDDGYEEPYIVTVDEKTEEIVNITPRFRVENIEADEDGKILKIKHEQHFTRYLFMPSFDGSFYGMGFGILLGPLNETINASINQLLDAGNRANHQSGFVGNGVDIGSGNVRFQNGEWKYVRTIGANLRDSIVPLPITQPSTVLFQLLSLMIDVSKELSAVTDVIRGETPPPDVPATTTLAMIEQGLKVFSSIYARIHRSLKSEFKKIRRLNSVFLTDEEYNRIIDEEKIYAVDEDYGDKGFDLVPISSTVDVSDIQKIIKARALVDMSATPAGMNLNQKEIQIRYLEALQIPDIEKITTPEPKPKPEPTFDQMMQQAELEIRSKEVGLEERRVAIDEEKLILAKVKALQDNIKTHAESMHIIAKAESLEKGDQLEEYNAYTERISRIIEANENLIKVIEEGRTNGPNAIPANRGENTVVEEPTGNTDNIGPAQQAQIPAQGNVG